MTNKSDFVVEKVTNRVIELLEKGEIPWRKPWTIRGMLPCNLITSKEYKGVNAFLLSLYSHTYASPYFLTFNQAKKIGGSVKKDEHAVPVIYWNWREKEVETEKENGETEVEVKKIPFMRYYNVFNVEQCNGLEDKIPEVKAKTFNNTPLERCEKIVDEMKDKPTIMHGGSRAVYTPGNDSIRTPEMKYFESAEEYYSTLYHELVHSTGHEKRLKRFTPGRTPSFGSEDYSKEELIAEMGSAYLCGICEIENKTLENSAAYIQGWLSKLRSDKRMLIYAAAGAQKSIDYILNTKEGDESMKT